MIKEAVELLVVNVDLGEVHSSSVSHHSLRLEEFHPSHLGSSDRRTAHRHTGRRSSDTILLCPFLRLARFGSSSFHYPRRRTTSGHSRRRTACAERRHTGRRSCDTVFLCPFFRLARSGRSAFHYPRRRTAGRHTHRRSTGRLALGSSNGRNAILSLIGASSDSLSLWPVYDVKKISIVGLFHVALDDLVEEIGSSCSVDELDREMLVACLLSELTVIVNVLRTDEFSCKNSSGMSYLLVSAVYE